MIRGYVDDRSNPVCSDCATDDEKESESLTVVLEEDDWWPEAIPRWAKCVRCNEFKWES